MAVFEVSYGFWHCRSGITPRDEQQ